MVFVLMGIVYVVVELINNQFMSQQLQRSYLVHLSGILTGFLVGPFLTISDFHSIGNISYSFKTAGALIYILAISVLIYLNI